MNKQVKLLVMYYYEVVGVIDCYPVRIHDLGMDNMCQIVHAPLNKAHDDYEDIRVGDKVINGAFYRNGLLLTPTEEYEKEHPEKCWKE